MRFCQHIRDFCFLLVIGSGFLSYVVIFFSVFHTVQHFTVLITYAVAVFVDDVVVIKKSSIAKVRCIVKSITNQQRIIVNVFAYCYFGFHFFNLVQKFNLRIFNRLFGCMIAIVTIFNFSVERISRELRRFVINHFGLVSVFFPIIGFTFKRSNLFKLGNCFIYFILIKQINSATFINICQFVRINSNKNILPSRALSA